jgi:hypothetical protein
LGDAVGPEVLASMLTEVAAGVVPALLNTGLSALNSGIKPPDVVVRLWLDDKAALSSDRQQDAYAPAWAPRTPNCVQATRAELSRMVRLDVVDVDLENDDSIGRRVLPGGVPASAFVDGVWNAGPFDAVGMLLFSFSKQVAAGLVGGLPELSGEVTLGAGTVTEVSIQVPGVPLNLALSWQVAGSSAGLAGARDDLLVGATLISPSGVVVLKRGKHNALNETVSARETGNWRLVFSNKGFIRSSARRVRWKVGRGG